MSALFGAGRPTLSGHPEAVASTDTVHPSRQRTLADTGASSYEDALALSLAEC
jgi:hypothetical protein